MEPSQSPKYRLVMRISLPEGPHPPSTSFNLDNPTFANWTERLYKLNRVSWELVIRLSIFVNDIALILHYLALVTMSVYKISERQILLCLF